MNGPIRGIIEEVKEKDGTSKTGNEYTMTTITVKGKEYSAFGKCDFDKGDEIQFVPEENGKYLNFKDPVLVVAADSDSEKIVVESLVEKPKDQRQRAITLGQSCNLSLNHIHKQAESMTVEEFNQAFKAQTRRFFKLVEELQEELL